MACRSAWISTMQASMTVRWAYLRRRSACPAQASNSSGERHFLALLQYIHASRTGHDLSGVKYVLKVIAWL